MGFFDIISSKGIYMHCLICKTDQNPGIKIHLALLLQNKTADVEIVILLQCLKPAYTETETNQEKMIFS